MLVEDSKDPSDQGIELSSFKNSAIASFNLYLQQRLFTSPVPVIFETLWSAYNLGVLDYTTAVRILQTRVFRIQQMSLYNLK